MDIIYDSRMTKYNIKLCFWLIFGKFDINKEFETLTF